MEAEKGTPVNYEHHSDTGSAFLRPKLGKQYEASCVSFERVLVENKLHGLSPALSEAIQSISRWELVQAALPHVLHCTAILLSNRNKLGHQDKLGVAETKLLHTLHWMLLDAAQECNHEAGVRGGRGSSWSGSSSAFIHQLENQGSPGQHPHGSTPEDDEHSKQKLFHKSMATVELFVFLFAPLIHRIKESDLTFRLASGLVIWQPMWEQKQPDVSAFTALIKPVRNIVTGASVQSCRRGNSLEGGGPSQASKDKGVSQNKAPTAAPPAQRSRYGTYFDVAVLRCLLQPHWSEEGTHWALLYCLQRLRQILEEKPERPPEPLLTQLPRPRSSSMVAAAPSLVNTHRTQDMSSKCNEEKSLSTETFSKVSLTNLRRQAVPDLSSDLGLNIFKKDMTSKCNEEKSLSTETFSKVSLTNLRRQAVPDLSSDLGLNIFKKFKSRKEERERKGSIPFHHPGKRRQRRMGVPFLLHEDHLDVSPTRSTFSFGSFSGIGDERRGLEKGGWQTAILGKFTRRGSSDTTADMDSLSARQSHSHHTLMSDAHDQPNSHGENTVKEVRSQISTITVATFNTTVASFNVGYADFFTEHMKKLCNPVPTPEMPIEPLACSNLPRSLTDSCINYSCLEDAESIEGTNNFILKNGMLDLAVILRAVYVVLTHDISSRICDVTLNIIECLLQLGVAQNCLTRLYKLDKLQFRQTVRDYVNKDSLNNVVDFLHAFLGFCMEPITDNKAGFGNNFTTGDSKSVAQNMEAVVVGCMFKSLITRCASTTHELHSPENLGLYCDIRQLVQFIKESHGNVFRRVALSALLDSTEKVTSVKKTEEKDETKLPGNRRSDAGNTNDKGQPSSATDECRSYISSRPPQTPEHEEQIPGALLGRKDFWRKMFKSQSAASDTSSQSEQDTSECTTAHSGTTTERRSRSRSRSRRISLRKKLKLPIDGVEDLLDISSVDRLSFIRQSSKVKFTSAVKLSEGGAMEYGRDDEENFFKRLGKWRSGRRNPSKLHHTEEKDGCRSFEERLAGSQEGMKNKNMVNLGAIRQGMKRFQFLLHCCEPGTIPDASILAAALDLEAPVVARASLFLECARFVHRCNRGNWPEWMKGHHVNIIKRGLSRGRSPVVGNKRNQKLQWNAAKHFCQWGDAIGARLSELCHLESESPANILGFIYDEETKRRMRKEDEEEDFLDDNTVNPTKCACPFALKMAACQLLLEITTFLRETFPCLPRPRAEPLVDLESCRLRLDPELDRHRYERKISFAGIIDDEEGRDSLHSSSHTLKSDSACEEKRAPIRKIRIGGSRLLQIKGTRSFRVKKGGSLSSIRRAGSLKSTKMSRQDSESENEEVLLSQSRDTVTDIGTPYRDTVTDIGTPYRDTVTDIGTPYRDTVTDIGTPYRDTVTDIGTPYRDTVTDIGTPYRDTVTDIGTPYRDTVTDIGTPYRDTVTDIGTPYRDTVTDIGTPYRDTVTDIGTPYRDTVTDIGTPYRDTVTDIGTPYRDTVTDIGTPYRDTVTDIGTPYRDTVTDIGTPYRDTVTDIGTPYRDTVTDIGGPGGGESISLPGVCPFRAPLQSWKLAGMDEGAPREHHQAWPLPGPLPSGRQQEEPEAPVECCQALLPAIGARLSELCHLESESPANILGFIYDEETKRRMRKEDEEEDFLDDNTVNPTKCACPFALKMAACQLLLEITTFLRETFPCLPRPRAEPLVDLESCRLRLDPELDRHRYERKISFAGIIDDEEGRDSLHSSSHTLKSDSTCEEKRAPIRKIRIGGSRLLQIKGTRSFRVKKGGSLSSIRRAGSLKSTKMSRQDSESENEEVLLSQSRDTVTDIGTPYRDTVTDIGTPYRDTVTDIGTPYRDTVTDIGTPYRDTVTDIGTPYRDTVTDIGSPWSTSEPSIEPEGLSSTGNEENYNRNMSWLHIMILLCNQQSFICTHVDFCHPCCYQHHSRSCARLVRAVKLLYGDTVDGLKEDSLTSNIGFRAKKTKECSDKSCLRTPSLKRRTTDATPEGKKDTGMLKYIRNQVMSLSPAPLSLLIKAAPILSDEMFGDIQPAAWELLLSVDEHMAAAAAALFLLCAVKVSDAVSDMMMSEFHHQEAVQRINSVLRFYTLWRFRFQVWPRMEEGAQQIFKIPPPSINFTLPSPILGMPCVPMFDPPWVPQSTGSVQDPINEDQSKSFSARAVSRSHQRAEHILKNLQQEEEKRRLGREASIITSIPITQEACYEPTCSPPSEQEEEAEEVTNLVSRRLSVSPSCTSSTSHRNYSFRRGSVWSMRSAVSAEDEENVTEHTPTHHVPQPPQVVFPACICAAVLPIVHLMEDGEVREDGVAVSAVAQQVLWNCLIEDPALVLRHFLEKLTVSNRQDELNGCEESTWYDREAHVCLCLVFQDELNGCEESTWYDREAHMCLCLVFQDEMSGCEESTWYDREDYVCLCLVFQDELNGCEESTWYDREAHVCLCLVFQDELNGCEESTWYDREAHVCQDELNGCEESTWYDREAHDELNGREESTWYDREAHVCLYLAFQDELNGREESTWYDREAHVCLCLVFQDELNGCEESTWYDREAHVCLCLVFQDELNGCEESTWYDREAHVCLYLAFQDELNGREESTWYDREAHVCLYLAFQDELNGCEESTWYDREAHVCLCLVFQDELIYMLRKLLLNIGDLPAQTSHILFNYLVGLIMYFVRTPCEWGMDAISATLTFLWEVVGYVEGLFFKDLKQTMKKEQCEVKLLVTASMPGTKTLVVHGQNECDIPTQLPVHEDTQFEALLKASPFLTVTFHSNYTDCMKGQG
ncbi:UNVERIFIED_CONTAM: hypothetical protein FKN15_055337 [Acipenser sinensis]